MKRIASPGKTCKSFVKSALAQPREPQQAERATGAGDAAFDFAKYGAIETQPLSRIQKISGANLHRNWVSIPHVTQFDEADITDMEAFRKQLGAGIRQAGHQDHAAGFHAQGSGCGIAEIPEIQRIAGRRKSDTQAILITSVWPWIRRMV